MSYQEFQDTNHEVTVESGEVHLFNEGDSFFVQRFTSWDQMNAFIAKLRGAASEAFGPDHSENDE